MFALFEGDEYEETRRTARLRRRARVRDSDYAVLHRQAEDARAADARARAARSARAADGRGERRPAFHDSAGHARPLFEEGERRALARTRPRFGRARARVGLGVLLHAGVGG